MKWTFASTGLVAAGLVGVVIILLFQNITVNNEEDYYLLKEISQAAMIDAIDLAHFRDYGKLKISQEKFVENFTRRFAEAANVINTNNYSLGFYNIMEYPPKVSVNIATNLGEYTIFGNHLESQEYSIANSLDSIIEIEEIDKKLEDCDVKKTYYSIPYITYVKGTVKEGVASGTAHIREPETDGDWVVNKIIPIGKIQMVSHVKIYLDTFAEMYYNPMADTAIIDPKMADFIAPADKVELESFELTGTGAETYVDWTANVECIRGSKDLKTYGGVKFTEPKCIYGIIYEVNWHNNACVE